MGGIAPLPRPPARKALERLGIVSYTNVAPLHHGLEPWNEAGARAVFVRGVPTELNRRLLSGEIDLTLVSSIEFLRHRHRLVALPDFSIAALGPVRSVMLFHWGSWAELAGARIAVSTDSATSVELLRLLTSELHPRPMLLPMPPDLGEMLSECDAALLIGDAALREATARREIAGRRPRLTDLAEEWHRRTGLPFTFAVWASRADDPPSELLVEELREARRRGLASLSEVAAQEAARLGVERAVVEQYLGNFRYFLEEPDRAGLLEFAYRSLHGFGADELRFWSL